ncbi:MAG: PQQ-binding-like beta-propeller repeat protein [Phenylobacterium sp.]
MTHPRLRLAVLIAGTLLLSGCAQMGTLLNFGDRGPKETAQAENRIPLVGFDQDVLPEEGLKGAGFYLPDPAPLDQWPLPGANPEQAPPHSDAARNLSVGWKKGFGAKSGRNAQVMAPPVAANGRIFVMDGHAAVSALDAKTGAQVWRTDLRGKLRRDTVAYGGGLAIAEGKLVVSSGYRFVAQLDTDTGAVLWRTGTEQPIHAAPTISGGRVFVVTIDNTLLTFDFASGKEGWTYQALSEPARILAASSPAVSGDTVVAAFGSGELVALRASNGNDLWSEALSRASRTNALSEIRDIAGRPVIYQGDVVAVSHSGVLSSTDLRTGQSRWSLPITAITTPWVAGDVIYVVDRAGRLYCLARETGLAYWVTDLGVGREKKGLLPSLGGGKDKKKAGEKPIWSSPILASGRLLLASNTGEMVAVNARSGEVERSMNLGDSVTIGPIALGDSVFFVTDGAQLIAVR